MADSVSITEVDLRPPKTPKLDDKAIVKPKPTSIYDRLRLGDPETDEYVRQFLLFHYQFHKTELCVVCDAEAERAAALVRVKPPYPLRYDIDKPAVVFRFAGPGEDPVPGTPFVFSRDGIEVDIESSSGEDEGN